MLAAVSLGLPTAIHEQNAVLGRANRLLAPRVRRIATGFPAPAGLRPADTARIVRTGNPVRPAVLALARTKYKAPQRGGSIELLSLRDLAPIEEPEETGDTFGANARLKAAYYAAATGLASARMASAGMTRPP